MTAMNLFKPAENTSAFLKLGIMGKPGSGKTYTGTLTAIGLIEHMRKRGVPYADKPMFFLDTELGSDWVKPKIEAAGIRLFQAKTRAFSDLLTAVHEAEANASVLLIDSITHFWIELCDAYAKKRNRTRLQFEDWAYLKGEWRKFTDAFVNSNLHTILLGRAAYDYDYFTDDNGRKQLEKTDIKMKAETDMGYEPSLLVLMERETDMETMKVAHVATVMKDRATLLDGKKFHDPTFDTFLPHVQLLNLGGKQMGIDTSRNSEHSINIDKKDWQPVQRRIAVDEIQSLLVLHIPGQAAADKKRKLELIRKHFNNASWTEIEEVMPLWDLRCGYDTLHIELEKKPSRYHAAVASVSAPGRTIEEELNDSIPDFGGKTTIATTKDRLLAAIPNLSSYRASLEWQLAHADDYETLPKEERDEVHAAIVAHNAKLKPHLHVVS